MDDRKQLPFDKQKAESVIAEFDSPIYLYDEAGIRASAKSLKKAFGWAKGYKNYFAVKATPTPGILKILHEEGMGFDCSSQTELTIMQKMDIPGEDIFFTANNVSKEDFELAISLDAKINIDDLTQLDVFLEALDGRSYRQVACRYTPEKLSSGGNDIIGEPSEAKYGMSLNNLVKAFSKLKSAGVETFGLHAMVVSNELEPINFGETARLVRQAVEKVEQECRIKIGLVNLGGGLGVAYKPTDKPLDINQAAQNIQQELRDFGGSIVTEHGRFVTGPNGYLLTKVRYVMEKYKTYVGVDASMHNLMRPGMYGAYHHITVLGKGDAGNEVYDVVGSLCENNDKFAINRKLPEAETGDILVIHDAGAHGHAMGFNYNGLLRSGEVVLRNNGTVEIVRRAENIEDVLKTAIF